MCHAIVYIERVVQQTTIQIHFDYGIDVKLHHLKRVFDENSENVIPPKDIKQQKNLNIAIDKINLEIKWKFMCILMWLNVILIAQKLINKKKAIKLVLTILFHVNHKYCQKPFKLANSKTF